MVALQGGDVNVIDRPELLPQSRIKQTIPASHCGFLTDVNAEAIGRACVVLGAGRAKTDDTVDFAVGVSGIVKIGERIERGQPAMIVHANDHSRLDEALKRLDGAIVICDSPVNPPPLVLEMIT